MENIEKMEQEAKIEITPYDAPWEIACMLINARYEREHFVTKEKYIDNFFDIDDLMFEYEFIGIQGTPK